ncbi:MAG: sigma-70 family RNA polymerase sigma factor [Candidatus Omnitrophica bacterium]|nr:sigma-70 family RNA polymerase sigma factor [Candidatus Omnitrophota bacterium]MDD5552876.1 sigma-70 family RNA polymerase sigma factor [Candidatus Omnitrophota bacterium]
MCFRELTKRISPKLKGIAYRLGGYYTFLDADDLYQEAMGHLWMDYTEGKLSAKTDSYILQGCYFYLKNYLRTHRPRAVLFSLDNIVFNENEGDPGLCDSIFLKDPHSLLDDIHTKFLLEQINNNGLTSREKEVFHLGLDGLTTREIGLRLGVSHVTVVKLRKTIRQKCRKHLDMD